MTSFRGVPGAGEGLVVTHRKVAGQYRSECWVDRLGRATGVPVGARSLPGRRVTDRPGLGWAHGRGRAVEAPQFLTEARQRFVTAIGLRGWRDAPSGFPRPRAMLLLAHREPPDHGRTAGRLSQSVTSRLSPAHISIIYCPRNRSCLALSKRYFQFWRFTADATLRFSPLIDGPPATRQVCGTTTAAVSSTPRCGRALRLGQ